MTVFAEMILQTPIIKHLQICKIPGSRIGHSAIDNKVYSEFVYSEIVSKSINWQLFMATDDFLRFFLHCQNFLCTTAFLNLNAEWKWMVPIYKSVIIFFA